MGRLMDGDGFGYGYQTLSVPEGAAINLSNLPVGNGDVKPVERKALVGGCIADETILYEAGTRAGQLCPTS